MQQLGTAGYAQRPSLGTGSQTALQPRAQAAAGLNAPAANYSNQQAAMAEQHMASQAPTATMSQMSAAGPSSQFTPGVKSPAAPATLDDYQRRAGQFRTMQSMMGGMQARDRSLGAYQQAAPSAVAPRAAFGGGAFQASPQQSQMAAAYEQQAASTGPSASWSNTGTMTRAPAPVAAYGGANMAALSNGFNGGALNQGNQLGALQQQNAYQQAAPVPGYGGTLQSLLAAQRQTRGY